MQPPDKTWSGVGQSVYGIELGHKLGNFWIVNGCNQAADVDLRKVMCHWASLCPYGFVGEQNVKARQQSLARRIAKAYGREEAARAVGFFAIAEEKAGVAGGAEVAREDICVAETGGEKLRAVGFAQIEANIFGWRLVARRHHVEPLQWIGFFARAEFVKIFLGVRKLRGEFRDEFGADFVAAPADRRTESRENVGRI